MCKTKHTMTIKDTPKMLLDIVKYPDKSLSKTDNEYVEGFEGTWLKEVVINMIHTMKSVRGVGLAGPQIGLPLRIAIALINNVPTVLINPKLTGHPDEQKISIEESCLSCPNESVRVPRYEWIKIDYNDIKGRGKWLEISGMNAIIVQHELDHLNGKTIMDYKNVGVE